MGDANFRSNILGSNDSSIEDKKSLRKNKRRRHYSFVLDPSEDSSLLGFLKDIMEEKCQIQNHNKSKEKQIQMKVKIKMKMETPDSACCSSCSSSNVSLASTSNTSVVSNIRSWSRMKSSIS